MGEAWEAERVIVQAGEESQLCSSQVVIPAVTMTVCGHAQGDKWHSQVFRPGRQADQADRGRAGPGKGSEVIFFMQPGMGSLETYAPSICAWREMKSYGKTLKSEQNCLSANSSIRLPAASGHPASHLSPAQPSHSTGEDQFLSSSYHVGARSVAQRPACQGWELMAAWASSDLGTGGWRSAQEQPLLLAAVKAWPKCR